MASVIIPSVYDELIEYLAEKATPEQVLEFRVSEKAEERAEELMARAARHELTDEEQLEIEQMLHFDSIVSVLKAKALKQISRRDQSTS